MARVFSKRDKELRNKKQSKPKGIEQRTFQRRYEPGSSRQKISTACPTCRREFGKYDMPEDAFRLREDIQTLKDMLHLLDRVEPASIARDDPHHYREAKEEGYQSLRRCAFIIGEFERIASDKLRSNFLAGERIKLRKKPVTLGDVWLQIIEQIKQFTEHNPREEASRQP